MTMMIYTVKKVLLSGILLCTFAFTHAQKADSLVYLYVADGYAINGFDPVAYFSLGAAKKGKPEFSFAWKGGTWLFIDRVNLEAFRGDPEKFAPQYGGYCAYGASKGYLAKTDPTAWTISGQKLYLNYNAQVKNAWLPDTASRIPAANRYWQSLIQMNNR